MSRARAALGSALFLVVAPGVMTVAIPWVLTGFDARDTYWLWRVVGAALIVAGAPVLLHAFGRFVTDGVGTPAPVAPPERLVVRGIYGWIRNPMYVAVAAVVVGEALLLGRPVLLLEAAIFLLCCFAFVRLYEEPNLRRRFGEDYERYCRDVPGWWPRTARARRGGS